MGTREPNEERYLVDHPTFHPQDWEHVSDNGPTHDLEQDGFIQALAARQSAALYDRFFVWVTVHEACNIVFPRSNLQERFLARRPVPPAFHAPPPDLLPDRAAAAAKLCALQVFREENNLK